MRCSGSGAGLLARTDDPVRAAEIAWLVAYSLMRSGREAEAGELVRQTLARPGIGPGPAARLTVLRAPYLTTSARWTRRPGSRTRRWTWRSRPATRWPPATHCTRCLS